MALRTKVARRRPGGQGRTEQRRACTPDVYRLRAGEIPNDRAITARLRRNRSSLSEACRRAAFDQAGG
nr:hypothetical protein [Bradyrhizobium sp. CCBAU 51765]